ncbi:helix-turn-helix domain-containing protein [Streptomyces rubradiris]|uniref:Helix-turn-helix domain-containing protein n=1 Tax=Streptomyces rubradiris TaxID=285531 RepID=A0ABQ3RA60_STRRR|nr:helix-turn-helix domain-containing protein [Streptomyces rubradiris]GHH25770.1 hypothetical protein GCM10018792_65230 [Streptomyces rubradiris]GHI52728.1 hypothetical protein Srubr_25740 [Streptomyces rubradiris]
MDETEPTPQQTGRPTPPTDAGLDLVPIPKGRRLTGQKRADFTKLVAEAYKTTSIRGICEKTGRSYGAIHRTLVRGNVTLRPRGAKPGTPSKT